MALITLGLDLGIISIGWAVIKEEDSKIDLLNWGSRIFEPGMEDDIASGKGVSRCKTRREKSALRTQYKRKRQRKDELYSLLTETGLLSDIPDENFIQKTDQKLLQCFPVTEHKRLAHLIPYLYRKKALDTPLTKEELARTIIHLAQRRGYLSNRKQELKDESSGIVLDGIKKLKDAIRESNCRTLGEYFCTVDPEKKRIRNTHTERSMYQEEFRMICQAQRHIVSEEMEKKLYQAIFYQRPLKSCKNLIGKCRIYPEFSRCPYTKDEAQLFRIITTVQNLRIEKEGVIRSLSEDERKEAIEFLNGFSSFFKKNGKIALTKLQKALQLDKKEKFTLSDDEKEIYGNELNNILFRAFGEKASGISQTDKEKFFNDLQSIRKTEVLLKRLVEYWKLSPETAKDIAGTSMPDDYCAFSLKALKEILPELMSGIDLNTVLKLKYPESNSCNLMDTLPLVDECGIELRNPVVHRVLTELRRVVNAVIARYGKPDRIRIELARDLKATNKEREKMTRTIREKEKERMIIAERIVKEAGIPSPSRDDITKVLLAEECNFQCPYSGKQLNMRTLFDGTVEIEHIIPYSRSFDNSFANKTLCVREYNGKKGNRTPFEAFGGSSEYKEMLARIKQFKGAYAEYKLELFEKEEIEEEEFLNRNLNDTRYASRLAMQYLALLYGGIIDKEGRQRIFASSGSCTALMRRAWGGNYLLGEGEKVRSDHRHHAIDALTISLTTPQYVKKIASLSPQRRRELAEKKEFLKNPVYIQAKEMLDKVAVTHHQTNKMRGELHNATFYSKDYGNTLRHVRIALANLSSKDLPDIVDKKVLAWILEKVGESDPEKVTDKMLAIFKDDANLPVMKDKNGNMVNVIKKVRVCRNCKTRVIGNGDGKREVQNSSNYVLAIFAKLDAQGNETGWEGEIVSLLDAVLRKQKGLPPFEKNRPGMKFKFSLQKGDIVSWEKDGKELLCIIRGISLPQFHLVAIKDARMKKEIQAAKEWYQPTVSAAFTGNMKKYNMNVFGELQRAND